MNIKRKEVVQSEELFVGIDIHKRTWHVTIRTDEIELFSGSIPARYMGGFAEVITSV